MRTTTEHLPPNIPTPRGPPAAAHDAVDARRRRSVDIAPGNGRSTRTSRDCTRAAGIPAARQARSLLS